MSHQRVTTYQEAFFMERTRGPIGINSSRTDTSLRQTQSALARSRFTSGLRRVDLYQSRIASGWTESACRRRPVALAHFNLTLGRSDILSTETGIERAISHALGRESTAV